MALRRANNFVPGTIYLPSERNPHFWVVLSDPAKNADEVLVVNWTTDPPSLLQRIREGAGTSVNTLKGGIDLLREQGFLPDAPLVASDPLSS